MPPQDLDAEAAVLSAVLTDTRDLEKVRQLKPAQFFSEANRWIFEAIVDLASKGTEPDVVTVAGWLRDRDRLDQVGGSGYLAQIADAVPHVAHLESYAARVVDKWRMRQLIATCQRVTAEGYGDVGEVEAFVASAHASVGELVPKTAAKGPAQRSAADIALGLASVGPRMPLSVPTLTDTTRGGLPSGRRVFYIGPPGSGKTGLVTQEILHQAQQGNVVAYLVADGDANDVVIRMGQELGFAREDLEAADSVAVSDLARRLAEMPNLMVLDLEDGWTVESAAEELHRRAGGKPTFLAVDSIQTVRTENSEVAPSPRERIDMVIKAIKAASKKYGHRILATSEAGRSAYRYGDAANRSDDIAAGKESGAIEYAADLQLVMRSVKGEDDTFDVTMPKNRLGPKRAFRLKLSFRLCQFTEVPMPQGDDVEMSRQRTEEERAENARNRILRALRAHTDLKSKSDVSRKAGGNKQANLAAIDDLGEMGTIGKVEGAYRLIATPEAMPS